MNPIEAAVMPLKTDAITRAEQFARQVSKAGCGKARKCWL